MDSASNLFEVIFKLALPVGGLSFLMVWWAFKKGVLQERTHMKALSAEIKAISKLKGDDKPKVNALHAKWLKFGGGFYGIVALYTYGLVEWGELRSFVADLGGLRELISNLNIGLVIDIFVEALKNFITAISWPIYWMREFGSNRIWIWVGIAYGAYWLGMKGAQYFIEDIAGSTDETSELEADAEKKDNSEES